jgi:hypothetical protein
MKYLKGIGIAIAIIIAIIILNSLEDELRRWVVTWVAISWGYTKIKQSIDENHLQINRKLDYIQRLLERD